MKVLIACEFSGIVREAFRKRGHDAISCDLLPSELPGPHIQDDVLNHLNDGWDLVIAFPPCTYLCRSGARWWPKRQQEQQDALSFTAQVGPGCHAPKWAVENPIGILSTAWRKPDQIIQPWQFGHGHTKATCLWLHNLPLLQPTNIVSGRQPFSHSVSPGPNRWKTRSRTYQGIADAMAEQWG